MRYVILDLATTCWEKLASPEGMEMIEIGGVLLPSSGEGPISEFSRFIRPAFEPELSSFCVSVTSVQQMDIDAAPSFKTVFYDLLKWIGPYPFRLCFWGERDLAQIKQDCERHHIGFPAGFERPISIKKAFADWKGIRPCTLPRALQMLGYEPETTEHPSLNDAWDIAKIAILVLPLME